MKIRILAMALPFAVFLNVCSAAVPRNLHKIIRRTDGTLDHQNITDSSNEHQVKDLESILRDIIRYHHLIMDYYELRRWEQRQWEQKQWEQRQWEQNRCQNNQCQQGLPFVPLPIVLNISPAQPVIQDQKGCKHEQDQRSDVPNLSSPTDKLGRLTPETIQTGPLISNQQQTGGIYAQNQAQTGTNLSGQEQEGGKYDQGQTSSANEV